MLIVKPYHSVFGAQFGVFPLDMLSEKGLEDRTAIYANLDDIRPSTIVRFDTQEQAERYVERVKDL